MIVTEHGGRGERELIVEPWMLAEERDAIRVDGTGLTLSDSSRTAARPTQPSPNGYVPIRKAAAPDGPGGRRGSFISAFVPASPFRVSQNLF
jgi:hypothetical protein